MSKAKAPRALVDNLQAFHAFVRKRVGDPDLAADVVQQALLKALEHDEQLRAEERLLAWFWRILRNTITDLHRRRRTAAKHGEPLTVDELPAAERDRACACLAAAIDTLPKDAASLLRDVDLGGAASDDAAKSRGITINNLNVRRHRARQALKDAMFATCRLCAEHGCVDCDCHPPTPES